MEVGSKFGAIIFYLNATVLVGADHFYAIKGYDRQIFCVASATLSFYTISVENGGGAVCHGNSRYNIWQPRLDPPPRSRIDTGRDGCRNQSSNLDVRLRRLWFAHGSPIQTGVPPVRLFGGKPCTATRAEGWIPVQSGRQHWNPKCFPDLRAITAVIAGWPSTRSYPGVTGQLTMPCSTFALGKRHPNPSASPQPSRGSSCPH
jgi:hypothetical protein